MLNYIHSKLRHFQTLERTKKLKKEISFCKQCTKKVVLQLKMLFESYLLVDIFKKCQIRRTFLKCSKNKKKFVK